MIIHGGFMEIGGVFCFIPAMFFGTDKFDVGQYFSFKLPYFQDNLNMMIVMGGYLRCGKNYWCDRIIKEQNVGIYAFCNQLHYNNGFNDVFTTSRNYGRGACE